ncbi:Uncharacterised protein [Mycobacteroides abscessus subsp. abscessus]|nr:Uncharacterised protein [Mycobacteroides abscessus subsp. abscessus]
MPGVLDVDVRELRARLIDETGYVDEHMVSGTQHQRHHHHTGPAVGRPGVDGSVEAGHGGP